MKIRTFSNVEFDTVVYFLLNSVTCDTCLMRTFKRHCLHRLQSAHQQEGCLLLLQREHLLPAHFHVSFSQSEKKIKIKILISHFLFLFCFGVLVWKPVVWKIGSVPNHKLYITSNDQCLQLGKFVFPLSETVYNLYIAFPSKAISFLWRNLF